ncbi:MAG: hypothetical protein KIT09_08700 [Bryobacteraceae bacterium]|nr:hypothetical protein [Bryobacteraceae bacterium]
MSAKVCAVAMAACALSIAIAQEGEVRRSVVIQWARERPEGAVTVTGGRLSSAREGPSRLDLNVEGSEARYGPGAAIVTAGAAKNPFSFFLRDVRRERPIYIPEYGVVVTEGGDSRSYHEIVEAIRARGLATKLERIASEPEESFEEAAANTRELKCQTWLGLGRDVRIFAIGERLDWIQPRFHGYEVPLPENDGKPLRYNFLMGRGWGSGDDIVRRLDGGVLPILEGRLVDDDVTYTLTAFAGLETNALKPESVRGTHFLVADGYGRGHMFTPEQQRLHDRLREPEMNQPEETVLYLRITADNPSAVPRYAFFKDVAPAGAPYDFDGGAGFSLYKTGRVFAAARLNGKPLREEEVAVELEPGESAVFEVYVPHRPISRDRAERLIQVPFDQARAACRRYWRAKLENTSRIHLPEKRIDEMVRAGLLHLDLVTYGLEPDQTLTSTIGVYSAIGSESSPIIQFMDSMGRHDVARRALAYFLDKQHDDGFIQNFGNYMLETGAALWSIGEHYRYTRDAEWARRMMPKLLKSCEYLRQWRARNLREDLRGKGYGMLDGKTADPEDPFHSFMLNGYAYLGLSRVAEISRDIDPGQAAQWSDEAEALKRDIRTAFFDVMGRSPVIPLANGTWCPTAPPWVEYRGPLALFADGGKWYTHGAMVSRDSLLGPIYLVFQEVLDPAEPASGFLLDFHNDLMTRRNAAFSQPYYSRHPIAHLRRGEVKAFLKAYYNTVASLADRETYTFWEHYFGASPHKTHEEGWFLMDTRWMLYMERGAGLDFLPGVPRRYLEDGNRIELTNVATYFGPASLAVQSRLSEGRVTATIECPGDRKPRFVEVRLPHPMARKALWVKGGAYNPETERVRVEPFDGRADIVLGFEQPLE